MNGLCEKDLVKSKQRYEQNDLKRKIVGEKFWESCWPMLKPYFYSAAWKK